MKKKKKLYELNYSSPSSYIKVSELDIPLPAMPPLELMDNYGLPEEEQKFRRTEIPNSLKRKKKHLSEEEKKFIEDEYHKRHHGVWVLIKNKPIYITGPYYHFLNYWWTKNGVHPEFRYEQALLYQLWDFIVRDINCYGLFLIKPRRVGGTEFTLHLEYEYATRVQNVKCGMQSKNDNSAETNFKRLTKAHKRMIWFMKPIHKGSDDPNEALDFKYPMTVQTAKKLRDLAENGEEEESIYEHEELGSVIDYGPSVAVHYDGEELNRYILNEFGKLEKMSAVDCWDKVKPCLHYDNGITIVGKAMFESTIEEINDEQIDEMTDLWEDSDPTKRDGNGRTTSGLYRVFIDAISSTNHDAWGFPQEEQNLKFLNDQEKELERKGKIKELGKLRRKTPRCVEDALTPSGNQSSFNKENLSDIYNRLTFQEDINDPLTVRGNFKWTGGVFDSKVYFEVDPEGKFYVRELLKDGDDNKYIIYAGEKYPANVERFRGGVDPYDHEDVADKTRASKGAGVIMKMYSELEDGAKLEDSEGISIPLDGAWDWTSKCPVAIYCNREDDPNVFFEDMLMMHIYYGTQMLPENNKTAIKKYFKDRGYAQYIMLRPQETIADQSKAKQTGGIAATTDTIDQYFTLITHYVMNYWNGMKFIDLVKDLQAMNRKNRGKHDLGVAFGWALIACDNKQLRTLPRGHMEGQEGPKWFDYHEVA
ncbi:hypothetical protein KO02_12300 [Sphingobacterium sp. ML3W]|uniref:hypothetical protein n=1 Tax=Sphingobacterium sp. ML3W TaxID=1538644 RepID=UPI0004F8ABE4|nr:hypothetical protein [Sphingobacterium sp. ML3W]AIM37386.1 hypothetical protein KO02_12300 [Sphingobacterium sp. ML3W]